MPNGFCTCSQRRLPTVAADCELFAINSEGKLAVEIATGPIRRMIAAAMEAKRPGTAAKHGLA